MAMVIKANIRFLNFMENLLTLAKKVMALQVERLGLTRNTPPIHCTELLDALV
jgi:hypothetical protein